MQLKGKNQELPGFVLHSCRECSTISQRNIPGLDLEGKVPSVLNTAKWECHTGYSSTEFRGGIQIKDINFRVIKDIDSIGKNRNK